ncbi:hypothetical protein RhiirA4_473979 [Rhizophagus irregularis]|uniref:Uncharacterized protein n=1 Tax=Rhizophagus irregularis TaxID=588596 RepID=A0A2I1H7R2_9GLOM|nr:hypothetical protein RhiirA4_473979 [Rhizophagus irregularis]
MSGKLQYSGCRDIVNFWKYSENLNSNQLHIIREIVRLKGTYRAIHKLNKMLKTIIKAAETDDLFDGKDDFEDDKIFMMRSYHLLLRIT